MWFAKGAAQNLLSIVCFCYSWLLEFIQNWKVNFIHASNFQELFALMANKLHHWLVDRLTTSRSLTVRSKNGAYIDMINTHIILTGCCTKG